MSAEDPRPACDLLLVGGLVLTLDAADRIIPDGAIAVAADRIVDIGPRAAIEPRWRATRTMSALGRVIIPGLINIHNHTPLMVTRGMIEDIGFAPMYAPGIPQGHRMSPDDIYAFARLGSYDLIRCGCTTIVDNYRCPEQCARAHAELGARAVVAGRIHDADPEALAQGRHEYSTAVGHASLDENIRLIEQWNGYDNNRIRCDWQPHAPDTCSDALLAEVGRLAASHHGNIHAHLSQSSREVEVVKARSGRTPAEALEEAGLLDRRLIAAHCIWVSEADIGRIGKARATVAHLPIGNAKSATVAPALALEAAGARITLGTDAFSNDLFEAMRWAIAMQRVRQGAFVLNARAVLRWATAEASEALGRAAELGSLAIDKKADIVLIDATAPALAPIVDGYGILVHGASGPHVETVIIDGRIVLEGGELATADGPTIVRDAQAAAERLWSASGRPLATARA
jgi:5-methylthioadenosine/S-adenosylhomocysteine deaminase